MIGVAGKVRPALKKPTECARDAARHVAARARRAGEFDEAQLDEYLRDDEGFDERVDALIAALGSLPLRPAAPAADGAPLPGCTRGRPRVPAVADDECLRGYLKAVHLLPRLDRAHETLLAKRLEFARRRFASAVAAAQVGCERLPALLEGALPRRCGDDLGLPHGDAEAPLAEACRTELRARAGEMNRARAAFVESALAIVADLALCYRTYGVPLMDLIQEGNGALLRAVEKFDWRRNVRFSTYATFWIRQAVERSIAFNKGIVRVPNYLQQKLRRLRREGVLPRRERDASLGEVSAAFALKREVAGRLMQSQRACFSLDAAAGDDGETFASRIEATPAHDSERELPLLQRRLAELLLDLSPLERAILEQRFGLDGSEPCTLEELGRRMNVSRERVRQLQCRALRKLQAPTARDRLAGFV